MRGGYDSRLNYVLWKRRKDVAADLRHIYQAGCPSIQLQHLHIKNSLIEAVVNFTTVRLKIKQNQLVSVAIRLDW